MNVVELVGVRLDASDPELVANFWAELLPARSERRRGGLIAVIPHDPLNYPILVSSGGAPKQVQNSIHFDLATSSPAAMSDMIARAIALGGSHVDVGQSPTEPHTVLVDPEENEFCVIESGNGFLAGTGAIGAINCDGTRELGYFWSRALGWPLVWDQDEETAIQAPYGGSKITWSGPPLMPRGSHNRLHLQVGATTPLSDAAAHLTGLGAVATGEVMNDAQIFRDPDGNEFDLLASPDAHDSR